MQKIFSVIVLCYRHFEYLFTAIDSVLEQDYTNIELIISDDGSPNFPKKEIADYIEERKRDNITKVIIRQQQENSGTVKHLNSAVSSSTGEFIVALAGDDALASPNVLTQYVQGFTETLSTCHIQMAQTAMYDEHLDKVEYYYVKPQVQHALEATRNSSDELYRLLLQYGACLPSTSTCFKRTFFEKFGEFDENFVLVEDYPMHMRLAKEHWVIHYQNFIAIKHRHGGISHGQKNTLSRSSVLYFTDEKNMIEKLILPQISELPSKVRYSVLRYQKRQLRWIEFMIAKTEKKYLKLFMLVLFNLGFIIQSLCAKNNVWAERWHAKMLILWFALNFITPIVGEMASGFGDGFSLMMTYLMYVFAIGAFTFWVIAFLMWIVNKVSTLIDRFPNEVKAIG